MMKTEAETNGVLSRQFPEFHTGPSSTTVEPCIPGDDVAIQPDDTTYGLPTGPSSPVSPCSKPPPTPDSSLSRDLSTPSQSLAGPEGKTPNGSSDTPKQQKQRRKSRLSLVTPTSSLEDLQAKRSYLLATLAAQENHAASVARHLVAVEHSLATQPAEGKRKVRRQIVSVKRQLAVATEQVRESLVRIAELYVEIRSHERWAAPCGPVPSPVLPAHPGGFAYYYPRNFMNSMMMAPGLGCVPLTPSMDVPLSAVQPIPPMSPLGLMSPMSPQSPMFGGYLGHIAMPGAPPQGHARPESPTPIATSQPFQTYDSAWFGQNATVLGDAEERAVTNLPCVLSPLAETFSPLVGKSTMVDQHMSVPHDDDREMSSIPRENDGFAGENMRKRMSLPNIGNSW